MSVEIFVKSCFLLEIVGRTGEISITTMDFRGNFAIFCCATRYIVLRTLLRITAVWACFFEVTAAILGWFDPWEEIITLKNIEFIVVPFRTPGKADLGIRNLEGIIGGGYHDYGVI